MSLNFTSCFCCSCISKSLKKKEPKCVWISLVVSFVAVAQKFWKQKKPKCTWISLVVCFAAAIQNLGKKEPQNVIEFH